MFPDFGKAGMPYAKSCRSVKALHGAKPDPGLLFDRGWLLGYHQAGLANSQQYSCEGQRVNLGRIQPA